MVNIAPFHRGQQVRKFKGYEFPGVVETCYIVSVGPSKGEWRVVVNCTAPGVEGCQHIFSPRDIVRVDQALPPDPRR